MNAERKLWKIRSEGTPRNPKYRVYKRRTHLLRGTEKQAKKFAVDLEEIQALKVLWIRRGVLAR